MPENLNYLTPPTHSFACLPVCNRREDIEADIAVIGIHYVSPYPQLLAAAPTQALVEAAPDAIRLFEVHPERDISGLTAATGAQLIINM